MFRCPSCAKVWKLPLTNGHSLLAHKDLNKWTIEREPIGFSSKVREVKDLLEVHDAFHELGLDFLTEPGIVEKDDVLEQGDLIECPSCSARNTFPNWHHAWEYPGDYFDADQICACGGELWYDNIIGTPKYALICEDCGWAKPKAVISGHAE